jgi:acyl carrier protein
MDHDHIKNVVFKHLRKNVEGLSDKDLDTTRSMLDLGASSLDVVEVVSAVMRELRLNAPRAQLVQLKSLDGLIDLLAQIGGAR